MVGDVGVKVDNENDMKMDYERLSILISRCVLLYRSPERASRNEMWVISTF